MKEFLTIDDLSQMLSIKRATLYAKVSHNEIPHFKIGHLIRFKKSDIDSWLEGLKQNSVDVKEKAKKIIKSVNMDIDRLVKKAIETEKAHKYNHPHGEQASKEGR